jgi:hypothetical protein
MIVLSNADPSREGEFSKWYDGHMTQVVTKLDGFVSAQRFKLADAQAEQGANFGYLVIYELEGDPAGARDQILMQRAERREAVAAGREPMITVSDTMTEPHHSWFFVSVGDPIVGPAA